MSEKTDQTSDPNASGGQKQNDPSLSELTASLAKLTASLDAEKEARAKAETQSRKHQSARDRLEALRAKAGEAPEEVPPTRPTLPRRGAPQGNLQDERIKELERIAEQAIRDNLLLTESAARGLPFEDVEDIEFSSATELRLILDNLALNKKIGSLEQSLKDGKGDEKPSEPPVDSGGPPSISRSTVPASVPTVQEEYTQARSMGRTNEARWKMLNAIHRDPDKLIRRSS